MLQFITLLGRYTGMDKRGLIVGGTHLLPGNEPKKLRLSNSKDKLFKDYRAAYKKIGVGSIG